MKELIEFMTKYLVDKPDEVRVHEIVGEHTVIYELHVGDGDMGKVIGKCGKTADSLRIILAAAAAKKGKRSVLEILETTGGKVDSSLCPTTEVETTTQQKVDEFQTADADEAH